jgi:ADP-heptose:LPS heptosyltransferase
MRILFIGPSRIGDAVLCSGVLSHLTAAYADARFTLAFGPVAAPLFADWPRLDAMIAMPKRPLAGHWFDLWKQVASTPWDLVVDTRGSALAYTVLARKRAVYRRTRAVMHKALEAAAVLTLDPAPHPHLYVSDARAAAAKDLMGQGPILAIAPVANWVGKTWPADRFAAVIPALLARPELAGARVAVLGAPEDRAASAPIFAAIPDGRTIDLVGQVPLLTLYGCLRHVRLFVGNDSGLMHMAAAAGVPTLGLFGPSDERKYAPFGPVTAFVRTPQDFSHFKALGVNLKMQECFMLDLGTADVIDAAGALLESSR